MTFFARPNLSDEQFKQLSGTTLTLSGQTRIANVTGLSILASGSTFVPIIVTGGTNFDVLTYYNGQILLHMPTSGTSSGVYLCASPTTVAVGGLPSGSPISGCTISKILEEILVPTLNPTLTNPSSSFSISPSTTTYEIGASVVICGLISFNQGCINPQFSATCNKRSGDANTHKYVRYDGTICNCVCTSISGCYQFPAISVCPGTCSIYGNVCYDVGVQPKKSDGTNYCSPLPASATTPTSVSITGILPWYWGTKAINCVCGCDVANGTCKCVGLATGVLPIIYNSSPTDYLWFAVPNGTPVKTCWYVNGTNNGCIGGVSNLFAASCSQTVTSCQGCWAGCTYMVYVSCTQTGTAAGVPMCMY